MGAETVDFPTIETNLDAQLRFLIQLTKQTFGKWKSHTRDFWNAFKLSFTDY